MLGNGTGVELGVEFEVEAIVVAEIWVKHVSEAIELTLAGFRDLFGAAGLAEARMSATLLHRCLKAENLNMRRYLSTNGSRRHGGTPGHAVLIYQSV